MSLNQLISQFSFTQILNSNPQTKTIILLGNIDSKDAIISIEKAHFVIENDSFDVISLVDDLQTINHNDVYFWSKALLKQSFDSPSAKLNLIYPATETHIRKYSQQPLHYVLETPDIYSQFVVPYIDTMKGDRIKWVYNILFEGKEKETFIYEDNDKTNGFVLLPDMKWDRVNMDALYLCCIVKRTDISSVRDLTGNHVEYLQTIKLKILQVACENYPINADELRLFIHYQPSYYHFHIHAVTVKHSGLGDGINVGKAMLLDDVIENLKLVPNYYQARTLAYVIGENHGLWQNQDYRNAVSS